MADKAEVDRQKDALNRAEGLLDRAQREPDVRIGDQTIVAEIVALRADLLAETQRRHDAETTFVLRHEIEGFKSGFKWLTGLAASLIAVGFAFWLGSRG